MSNLPVWWPKNLPPLTDITKHLSPLHDRVIVVREPEATKTSGGLHLPASAQGEIEMSSLRPGVVVAVGIGRWDPHANDRCPMLVSVGDRVVMHKNAGEKFWVWGQCFQIVGDGDIGMTIRYDTPLEMVYAQVTRG